MKLDFSTDKTTLIVRVSGEMDITSADDFRREVDLAIEKNCSRNIILNMEGVGFIDSSGLGAILGRYRLISLRGGKLAIVGAPAKVRRILELSGIFGISQAFDSESEALQAM